MPEPRKKTSRADARAMAEQARFNGRDPTLPIGTLPLDVQLRLKRAAQTGEPGSLDRQIAINRVYGWSSAAYPAYFRD